MFHESRKHNCYINSNETGWISKVGWADDNLVELEESVELNRPYKSVILVRQGGMSSLQRWISQVSEKARQARLVDQIGKANKLDKYAS